MSSAQPPHYPGKLTIALFGKSADSVSRTGSTIIRGPNASVTKLGNFVERNNNQYRIISTSDFFEEQYDSPDQLIIDFMALSDPGPRLFILVIDSKNTQVENVVTQISRLQHVFGENVTENIVIVLEESRENLQGRIKEMYNIQMVTMNENLAVQCKEWCSHQRPFQFDYRDYPQHTVKRRKDHLMRTRRKCDYTGETYQSNTGRSASTETGMQTKVKHRHTWHAQKSPWSTGASYQSHSSSQQISLPAKRAPRQDDGAYGSREGLYNVVLLGKSGTGKSASANTILTAGKLIGDSNQHFQSYPSSTPVTTKCEVKILEIFGIPVRVVDTPDFFYEEEHVNQAQVEECKRYCQEGHCVMLLVMQLGRFTDGERDILEKLEKSLGWRIRENTIILFTHGEDLKGSVDKFTGERSHLKRLVEACSYRYHVFRNSSKDSKQFKALVKKFPDMFPNFPTIRTSTVFCLR
uniref:AIG1-type G domain-containing protein n=2 Tax=Oreochromis aureus TaxID=47969 RepID=A0AAZ1XBQ6_OREAU